MVDGGEQSTGRWTRLNLGCGGDLRGPPWINADKADRPESVPDGYEYRQMDAGQKWPFTDSSFERIEAHCVLPHIAPPCEGQPDGLHTLIQEAWRTLRPGGTFTSTHPDPRVPWRALGAPHHYRLIGRATFEPYLADEHRRTRTGLTGFDKDAVFEALAVHDGVFSQERALHTGRHGRPMGQSRILAGLLRVGPDRLGILTHVWRRLRIRAMLRGPRQRIQVRKPMPR